MLSLSTLALSCLSFLGKLHTCRLAMLSLSLVKRYASRHSLVVLKDESRREKSTRAAKWFARLTSARRLVPTSRLSPLTLAAAAAAAALYDQHFTINKIGLREERRRRLTQVPAPTWMLLCAKHTHTSETKQGRDVEVRQNEQKARSAVIL